RHRPDRLRGRPVGRVLLPLLPRRLGDEAPRRRARLVDQRVEHERCPRQRGGRRVAGVPASSAAPAGGVAADESGSVGVRPRPDARWRDTPTGVLILGDGDEIVCLEGAGRLVWLVLDEPATVAELAAALPDDAVAGLDEGLEALARLGLVELT